jgi:hypothetical protein
MYKEFEELLRKLREELKADKNALKTWGYINNDTATTRGLKLIEGSK